MNVPPVLCYHKVDARLELGVTRLGPSHFRRQVETLAALGFRTLGAEELLAAPGQDRGAPLVITFDDGYAGLERYAFPVLADHGLRAMVFVISDYVGRDNAWDVRYGGQVFHHLDWDVLGRWQERGIEVHAHGASHGRLTWMSDLAVADDLGRAREAIRRRLGREASAIAYPFGAVDARVRRLALEAGFTVGFAGPIGGADDVLRLPRLPVYPWDRAGVPFVMQAGALGALARWGGRTTNRIAVTTALIQRLLGTRYR